MAKGVRRVVTGHDKDGTAVVLYDNTTPSSGGEPEMGVESFLVWLTKTTPADLTGSEDAAAHDPGIPPPPNGSTLRIVDFYPETEAHRKLPVGHLANMLGEGHMPGGKPVRHHAMHRTKSIDYIIILSGEIDMMLDDSEVHLKAGDIVVQRGTNHAWINRGKEPCRIAAILIDAKPL
jgi:mannose-6-phosphate isomerase-like protein (cupin superfamily)